MITREQLLSNETYWIETIQNRIFSDLKSFIEEENISQKEIAKRLGVSKGRVSQILNGNHLNFRLETVVRICLAVGKVPNFHFDNIENFINKDKKTFQLTTSDNPEYFIKTSSSDNTISFLTNELSRKTIPLNKEINSEFSNNLIESETRNVI